MKRWSGRGGATLRTERRHKERRQEGGEGAGMKSPSPGWSCADDPPDGLLGRKTRLPGREALPCLPLPPAPLLPCPPAPLCTRLTGPNSLFAPLHFALFLSRHYGSPRTVATEMWVIFSYRAISSRKCEDIFQYICFLLCCFPSSAFVLPPFSIRR